MIQAKGFGAMGGVHPGLLLAAGLATAAVVSPMPAAYAAKADYCVTCKNPSETYRCRVKGAKPSDALKLYCVIRTAKEGNHSSCKAKKATTDCVGLVKVYTYDGPPIPDNLTSDPRVRELQQRVEQDRRTFKEPDGDEPSSLIELGGQAVDASKRGLRNAGAAIGIGSSDPDPAPAAPPPRTAQRAAESDGFARRSYRCMRSLFRNCGSVDKEALD